MPAYRHLTYTPPCFSSWEMINRVHQTLKLVLQLLQSLIAAAFLWILPLWSPIVLLIDKNAPKSRGLARNCLNCAEFTFSKPCCTTRLWPQPSKAWSCSSRVWWIWWALLDWATFPAVPGFERLHAVGVWLALCLEEHASFITIAIPLLSKIILPWRKWYATSCSKSKTFSFKLFFFKFKLKIRSLLFHLERTLQYWQLLTFSLVH